MLMAKLLARNVQIQTQSVSKIAALQATLSVFVRLGMQAPATQQALAVNAREKSTRQALDNLHAQRVVIQMRLEATQITSLATQNAFAWLDLPFIRITALTVQARAK